MKQVLVRAGEVVVEDVPAPAAPGGGVVVRVTHSCISAGTEGAGISAGRDSLLKRAIEHPDRVRAVVEQALDRGIRQTFATVRGGLRAGQPTGYSVAGRVAEVGPGVMDLAVGDAVACAGSGLASHAEYVAIPRNLVARVPAGLPLGDAATVTVGAIALHGVRRLEPTLGECFVVVGLGLLGQLGMQLLRASGCRVIGVDPDARRVALARSLGMEAAVAADDPGVPDAVRRLTNGVGADGVLVTASGASDEILAGAFHVCRRKGRVVVVGDVGLGIRRGDIYPGELELRISTSYGPGRYDPRYEEAGLDYPIGYVRWTENRNMEEYLRLLAEGRVRLAPLVGRVFSIDEAPAAFAWLESRPAEPIALLAYPDAGPADRAAVAPQGNAAGRDGGADAPEGAAPPVAAAQLAAARTVRLHARPAAAGRIGVAVVGAGAFARGVHLPNLRRLADDFELRAVASRTGATAREVAAEFGAATATTDYDALLADDAIDAVILCTRHDLHAAMALRALEAGKHVLVEKPLALSEAELETLTAFFTGADAAGRAVPVLLTGFNRRFSPAAERLRAFLAPRAAPAVLDYRMNAGYIPLDHWVHGAEGGGRNIGEACHVYDLFGALVGAPVERVEALSIAPATAHYARSDNFVATLRFADGSLASLTYTALGGKAYPKERLEVFSDGAVASLDDYRTLTFHGGRGKDLASRRQDKGHLRELEAFGHAIAEGGTWPIPLEQQVQATRVSFAVERALLEPGPTGD